MSSKKYFYLIDYHSHKISSEKKFDLVDSPSAKLLDTPSKEKNLSFEVTFNIMPDIDLALIDKINLKCLVLRLMIKILTKLLIIYVNKILNGLIQVKGS